MVLLSKGTDQQARRELTSQDTNPQVVKRSQDLNVGREDEALYRSEHRYRLLFLDMPRDSLTSVSVLGWCTIGKDYPTETPVSVGAIFDQAEGIENWDTSIQVKRASVSKQVLIL